MDFNNKTILLPLINECKKNNKQCQQELYQNLFGFAMKICLRYAKTDEEAREIAHDGFLKIFTKLDKFDPEKSFLGWVRKIMINASIDHFRKNHWHYHQLEISHADGLAMNPDIFQQLSAKEILQLVNSLPPSYKVVFNLYVIDGYNHREIAEKLEISEGTSKSNLAKARLKLKKMLVESDKNTRLYG
ncbi:MAG: RNA polymerase sigma factor [Candidatus Cyclobacteriaceae bacterium M3_2C_046]